MVVCTAVAVWFRERIGFMLVFWLLGVGVVGNVAILVLLFVSQAVSRPSRGAAEWFRDDLGASVGAVDRDATGSSAGVRMAAIVTSW